MRKIMLLTVILVLLVGLIPGTGVMAQDEEETFALTVMHTNDTHAHYDPDSDGNGGAAREASVVKQIRAEVDNSLLVDAGDRFTGSLYHVVHQGQDNVQMMNMLGYDVMTLGNHEFDKGDEVLSNFLDGIDFPAVSANIDFSASELLAGKVAPYTVLEVGGEQIGVIGLTLPDTPVASSPSDDLVFMDNLAEITQGYVDELTEMGVNKIILLTHLGINVDMELAPQLTGVDVLIGGHSHTLFSETMNYGDYSYPVVVDADAEEPMLIVSAGQHAEFLGRLDVVFDANGAITDWGGDTILLSKYITPDAEVTALLDELAAPIAEFADTVVGETSVFLVGDRSVCRAEECNLGNLITDAMRESTGVQIAIQNGGGIRADIDEGEITMGEVLTVLPFGNLTSTFELSGADVIAALENGVSQVEDGAGRFPQVSGLSFTWDGSKPAGERVMEVLVMNEAGEYEPIDPEAIYTVASNDYMRGGGDGYTMFEENAMNAYDYGSPLDQVLADYITAHSPVAPEVEERIVRLDE